MAPKKGKDVTDDDNYWRLCIEEAPLDDESWKVKVIMIEAAGSDQDRIYLNKFETCAAEERRFVIKNICKTETIFMINQLGGEKKIKDDNLRVFEEGQAYLKEKKDVPPEIMALIIKNLILKMKDEYLFIKRQRLEVREGMKRESVTMINRAEVRGTVNVKLPESEPPIPPPPPPKGKKGEISNEDKQIEIDENKKYSTLLRVRGEEWRDKVYIDDFPADGPNLYIAVTGFLEPGLAGCLLKIGIPLTAVVQIRIDPAATTIPSSLFRATNRGQSQTEILAEKSLKFWEDLQQLRINRNSADDFKNTAFLVFSPPYWSEKKLSGCHEKIYDELCYLMYDIQDLTRQHSHYLNNMDIITVPEESKEILYQQLYLSKIEELPLESITIYSVLHAILQTVSEQNLSIGENNSRMSYSTIHGLTQDDQYMEKNRVYNKSEELVSNLISNLCKIDTSKNKYRVTYGEEYENHKNPIIIDHGDFCKYNTFHLGNINLNNIVYSMLSGMPINKIWINKNKPVGEIKAKIIFHINMLLSCFDRNDIETAELNRLIHILAFRKVYNNRSSLKKEHLLSSTITEFKKKYLKRSVLAEPLPKSTLYTCASSKSSSVHSIIKEVEEFSRSVTIETDDETCRIRFLFDCPDISELASAAEITSQKPISHMIDDFEYFEDFAGINAFQIILDAFNKFNCVDYKYCEVTDCFILMFYNSHDKNGIARDEWRCHLPTPLCLQDFFDFVLEEHYDWIKNEEDIYDESIKIKTQSECKDAKNQETGKSCVDNTDVELELLMGDSLKYEEMKELEVISPETSNTKILSSKKTNSPVSHTDLDSKSSKRTKSPAFPPPKANFPVDEEKVETIRKEFSGYDLGDRRVEIFGKDSTFFSEDGTRVSTFYSLLIPMNLEYVTLNIVPGNSHNEFWMHKALGEFIDPNIVDTCESYRVKTKDQLIMYIKKESFQVPIYFVNPSSGETIHKSNIGKSPSPDLVNPSAQFFESKLFYSLFITWPTGLVTETVYKNNSPNISHIKQYYVTNCLNSTEDMRCISLDGETIIFNSNGDIEILKPDSSYLKITKCEKRSTIEEVLEDAHSATGSDKNKKGKDKGKEKPTKTSSKSSKNILEGNERVVDSKATEYELHIEEFEIIENNGLKEKWINDKILSTEKVLIKTATDFCLGEIFSRRMDGTNTLLNKDGILIVTFPNNTRISTSFVIDNEDIFPEWTEEEIEYLSLFDANLETDTIKSKGSESHKSFSSSHKNSADSLNSGNLNGNRKDGYVSVHLIYVIEHPNFTTVTIDKFNDKISIESPNDTCVTIDSDNNYEFSLDNATSGRFNGQSLNINYVACTECKSYNNCDVKITSDEINSVTEVQRNWLKMTDSFGKNIIVNEEGNISIIQSSENILHYNESEKSELSNKNENEPPKNKSDSIIPHTKCREMYQANSLKFLVLKR